MLKIPPDDQLQRSREIISERDAAVSAIRPCLLLDYRGYVGHLPRPSEEQIEDWVQFVSQAHSWYKHLPVLPPGQPFHFFLDPFSGYDHIIRPGGGLIHQERTETSFRFHYTWMTTKEYRRRFGYLAYESGAGTRFVIQIGDEARDYGDLPIFFSPSGPWRIPPEVAEAGSVELTSLIHPYMGQVYTWAVILSRENSRASKRASRHWPPETGGDETFRQAKEVVARAFESNRPLSEQDEALERLVLPERKRLQRNMTEAVNRMLALVYDRRQ